jgi:acyl carrier protein
MRNLAASSTIRALIDAAGGDHALIVRAYMRGALGRVLGLAPESLDPTRSVCGYGLDSINAVELKTLIEADFGIVLTFEALPADVTIDELVAFVVEVLPYRLR